MRLNSIADINQTFLDLQGKIRNPGAIVDGVGIWSSTGLAQLKWWCQLKVKPPHPQPLSHQGRGEQQGSGVPKGGRKEDFNGNRVC